jgi:hypothetical protein
MIGKWLSESSCCRQRSLFAGGTRWRTMLLNPCYFVFEVSGNQLLSQPGRTHAAKLSHTGNCCLSTPITKGHQKGSADCVTHRGRKSPLTAVQSHDFSNNSRGCAALLGRGFRSRLQVTFLGCGHRRESSGTAFAMSISVTRSSLEALRMPARWRQFGITLSTDAAIRLGAHSPRRPFIHIRATNTLDLSPK